MKRPAGWAGRKRDMLIALGRLTALPFGKDLEQQAGDDGHAAWAYPLIGALIGLFGGLIFLAAITLGLGIGSAALLAILGEVLLTGGRHERGLARLADGFRGFRLLGAAPEGHGLGLNAVLALILCLALRASGIEDLANSLLAVAEDFEATVSYGTAATIALVLAGAGSRAAMVWVWFLLPPAPADHDEATARLDYGSLDHDVPLTAAIQAAALAALCGLLLLSLKLLLAVALAIAVVALLLRALGQRRLGGQNDSLLGTTQQVAEVAILLVLSATAVVH
ncbi:adenosylcobinamide-GDP ribazoletransferase [Ferrovibrio sp.]|uniref:adenosylcobinamide-GDP ribazoletransferase n=1 Tax=Ferrovibrio sp. TaxID=1917215 RepID=UPI003D0B8CD5